MNIRYYERKDILDQVGKLFKHVSILVDVGCGILPTTKIKNDVHICIEPYKEYADILKGCHPDDGKYVILEVDAISGLKSFADNSVDTVYMADLIEHIEKDDGYVLLKEADRIARKQIIVYTPLGFLPNHSENKDAWGLSGMDLQEHKSGWMPEDFLNTNANYAGGGGV